MSRVDELLEGGHKALIAADVASPRHDAQALLAFVLGVSSPARLPATAVVTDDQARAYTGLLNRRASREPLQYLLGTAPFRYVELAVGPGVFIPRPETEVVAGWAIDLARDRAMGEETPVVVDLCTGSGAIALSVATEVSHARVYAVEFDARAYAWAERNLSRSSVTLVCQDADTALDELNGSVDVVVANPPYIPLDAYESIEPEVRDHDPALALWAGPDGLDVIRAVERAAVRLLRPGGYVACEHADAQATSAPGVFAEAGHWSHVRDHRDLSERSRFVTARRMRNRCAHLPSR